MKSTQTVETIDFHLFHGWALTPSIWNQLIARIEESLTDFHPENLNFHLYDRGYFGDTRVLSNPAGQHLNVVITHSLGLHFVPGHLLLKADFTVILSGFVNFHSFSPQKSKKILNRMIDAFQVEPERVLSNFYENMFFPEQVPVGFMNEFLGKWRSTRMIQDLHVLNQGTVSSALFSNQDTVLVFHGEEDKIATCDHAKWLLGKWHMTRGQVFKNAGHAIPVTHTSEIAEHIRNEIIKRYRLS